jgi:hypothetical protein
MGTFMGWTLREDLVDVIKFTALKVIPRAILAILLSLLFASLDYHATFVEVLAFLLLFGFLIFYYMPPGIDTIYAVRKTGDPDQDKAALLKLLRCSKDSASGIFSLGESFVIKNSYGQATRTYLKLKDRYPLEGYEIIRASRSKKGFQQEYCQLLDTVAWRLVEEKYGSEAVQYHEGDLKTFSL